MSRWKEVLIPPTLPILKAIELIDLSSLQIALVVDEGGRLIGTVTDGDIRRGILKGIPLSETVCSIMCTEPTVASSETPRENILSLMQARQLRQIPIVDSDSRVVRLEVWDELLKVPERKNAVVLMAGGLGTRLAPLTDACPKPLLKVGNKPALETILESCCEYGFRQFHMAVNYKSEMLREYFGDGSRWGVDISYICETKRLGTAGALGLLPDNLSDPLLVVNADVLTKVNFQQLMDFHVDSEAAATMCVREYDFQVPYGVVEIDRCRLVRIEEKPIQSFFVNAGLYVLNPEVLKFVEPDAFLDMPVLFERLLREQLETAVFPIREYWVDIGKIDDYERANGDFARVFHDR